MARRPGAYVALLRGINVGGKNRLPMKDLVAIVEALGATDVRTYIASGNVVFRAPARTAEALPAKASQAIRERLGLDVAVVLRTAAELDEIVRGNPYLAAGADAKKLAVMFLRDAPAARAVAALDPARWPGDAFTVRGRDIYLSLGAGFAGTKLTNDWFERHLDTPGTARNWQTVGVLRDLAAEA
jgi:uncharacterized protein (DUF1697 family)